MNIQDKQKLTEKQISILSSEMEKNKKSTGLAYALWFFFGSLGIHKFYIGKPLMGVIYLLCGIFGWVGLIGIFAGSSSSGAIGILCLAFLGLALLLDLFTIPSQLRKIYEANEKNVLTQLSKVTN